METNVITQQYLKELLKYNKTTGKFTWKVNKSEINKARQFAGTEYKDGYIYITIDGKRYKAHRLAWFYITNTWPKVDVDHKNRIRNDNRWCNLREATDKDSRGNTKLFKNNKSGLRGVYWNNRDKSWVASIRMNKKLKHLGSFQTKEAASKVYIEAAKKYFGEFYNG